MPQVKLLVMVLSIFFGALFSMMAQQDQSQKQNQPGEPPIIELEAQILDTRLELPQVQILDKRKRSEFDEVKVEKSFRAELSRDAEEIKLTPNTSGEVRPIEDINVLLNKKRF